MPVVSRGCCVPIGRISTAELLHPSSSLPVVKGTVQTTATRQMGDVTSSRSRRRAKPTGTDAPVAAAARDFAQLVCRAMDLCFQAERRFQPARPSLLRASASSRSQAQGIRSAPTSVGDLRAPRISRIVRRHDRRLRSTTPRSACCRPVIVRRKMAPEEMLDARARASATLLPHTLRTQGIVPAERLNTRRWLVEDARGDAHF